MFTKLLQLILIMVLPGLCSAQAQVTPSKIAGVPAVDSKDNKSGVTLKLYENQDLPIGLGFSVSVEGWAPNDFVKLEAISPTEQKVSLLDDGATLPVSPAGKSTFSLPYKHKNLYPGRWVLVVYGKSGAHAHYFNVPRL